MNVNQAMLGLAGNFSVSSATTGVLGESELPTDPMASRYLTIDDGSRWGGGGSTSNPLALIFPNGESPRSPSFVGEVAVAHHLTDSLLAGTVHVWVQNVHGSGMPRLNTLSVIPAPAARLYEVATQVDTWADWMPRFKKSSGIPLTLPNTITHEVLMDGGPSLFHYQSRMEYGVSGQGSWVLWFLDQRPDFKMNPKARGLKINDGSWTFTPFPGRPEETLMAYQIHVEPDVNGLLLRTLKPLLTALTLGEFDRVISAVANRAVDPAWTQKSGTNPSGRRYVIRKV